MRQRGKRPPLSPARDASPQRRAQAAAVAEVFCQGEARLSRPARLVHVSGCQARRPVHVADCPQKHPATGCFAFSVGMVAQRKPAHLALYIIAVGRAVPDMSDFVTSRLALDVHGTAPLTVVADIFRHNSAGGAIPISKTPAVSEGAGESAPPAVTASAFAKARPAGCAERRCSSGDAVAPRPVDDFCFEAS
jgi:hypothetical protein